MPVLPWYHIHRKTTLWGLMYRKQIMADKEDTIVLWGGGQKMAGESQKKK